MSAIPVIGMHRSGTSLVASLLQALGVHMGDDLLSSSRHNPHGHFEDRDFYDLNELVLHEAGGDWKNPPGPRAIVEAGRRLGPQMENQVIAKQRGLWGWKDPRNCLTMPLYHRHLEDPRYVVVRRDPSDVVSSLEKREGAGADWQRLYLLYWNHVLDFLDSVDAPVLHLRYEDLTHPKTAEKQVRRLARFVGVEDEAAVQAALARIEYRDRWGFGSVGIGVPLFKFVPEFWLSWTHLLLTGLDSGDKVLNNTDTPMATRLPLAHNTLIRQFLASGRDTFLFIEDDHAFEPDQLRRMRTKMENQEFDIVCASYTNRRFNGQPLMMGWNFKPDMTKRTSMCHVNLDHMGRMKTGTLEFEGAAFGFTLVRRWVLEAMARLPDGDPDINYHEWVQCVGEASPDVPFYWDAREVGARVGVDRDNWVGHMGSMLYSPGTFHDWWDIERENVEALQI